MSSCPNGAGHDRVQPLWNPGQRGQAGAVWLRWRDPSLHARMLAWALLAITSVWAVSAIVGYRAGVREADEWMNGQLASVGALIAAADPYADEAEGGAKNLREALATYQHYQRSLSVFVWDADGRVESNTGPAPIPAAAPKAGFTTVALGRQAEAWRTFTRIDMNARRRTVTVLLSMRERDDQAWEIAGSTIWSGLWTVPGLLGLAALGLRRGLNPMKDLVSRIDTMNSERRSPAPPLSHIEFQPLLDSIERLTDRWRAAVTRERELTDTLAHELRTPLASLQLHASSLQGDLSPSGRAAALFQIDADAKRAAAIIEDLMVLARAGLPKMAEDAQLFDLAKLARLVTAEHANPAYRTGHQLGLIGPESCIARGHPSLIKLALGNLIANALRHTPPGTAVEIEVLAHPPTVCVRDNGGARPSARMSSTAAAGLGLGHRIVQRVAEAHNGQFTASLADGHGWKAYSLTLGSDGFHVSAGLETSR